MNKKVKRKRKLNVKKFVLALIIVLIVLYLFAKYNFFNIKNNVANINKIMIL